MPTPSNNRLPQRPSPQRCDHPALIQRCDLRPDLAAFFVARSRELAPERIIAEHGVLAELRALRGRS